MHRAKFPMYVWKCHEWGDMPRFDEWRISRATVCTGQCPVRMVRHGQAEIPAWGVVPAIPVILGKPPVPLILSI